MKKGLYNLVVDGQYGSCGKGLVSGYLAHRYRPQILACTNMANAGHTIVDKVWTSADLDLPLRTFVAKALPSPAALHRWYPLYSPLIMVGPSGAFHLDQILKEIEYCHLTPENLWIHPRAGVITQAHRDAEASLETGTKHIGSTMQGCGTFLADKILRRKDLKLARDYEELAQYCRVIAQYQYPDTLQAANIVEALNDGATALHEGSQGFGLDIHHGSHYPNCTSRQCTATQCVADMGVPMQLVGDVYLVVRPFPIRVGNIVENGQVVGHSGGCYPDQEEITWQTVGENAGMPQDKIDELKVKELTTVTKRLRRVFTFSDQQLKEAALINGATRIFLNFANYISWEIYGANTMDAMTPKLWKFIRHIEEVAGIPVTMIGTGPRLDNVVEL